MEISRLAFRSWYYFRQGWATYFAFIMAAINTLTVTYYLAIEKYPVLSEIFPSFAHYVLYAVMIGIPVLTLAGYAHFKKLATYKAEADISMEINPYNRRLLINTEIMLPVFLKMSEMMTKIAKNEKLTEEEAQEITKMQNELSEYINLKSDQKYRNIIETDIEKIKDMEKKHS